MLGDLVDQRLAILLQLEMAQEHVPNLHLCKAHWTVKKGKPSGRPLGDLSNVDGTKINTDETAYYGEIRHPTIDDIAVMIYDFWRAAKARDPSVKWEDMSMAKYNHYKMVFIPQLCLALAAQINVNLFDLYCAAQLFGVAALLQKFNLLH
jgi:hypothetical protein